MRRRVQDDGHQLLPRAPDAAARRAAGDDAVAREAVRLDVAQRRKRDGILPPAHQSRGRTGQPGGDLSAVGFGLEMALRSEEHTSELQSLMRISYAVFCLQKKQHTGIGYI